MNKNKHIQSSKQLARKARVTFKQDYQQCFLRGKCKIMKIFKAEILVV